MMFRSIPIAAAALTLSACAPIAPPAYLAAPAVPAVEVRDPVYVPVTAGVKNYEVTGPKDWIEQNREVAPRAGEGHGDHGMDSSSGARRAR